MYLEKMQGFLEVKKDERVYKMELDRNSPLGEIFDVLTAMRAFVVEKIMEEQKGKEIQEEKSPEGEVA